MTRRSGKLRSTRPPKEAEYSSTSSRSSRRAPPSALRNAATCGGCRGGRDSEGLPVGGAGRSINSLPAMATPSFPPIRRALHLLGPAGSCAPGATRSTPTLTPASHADDSTKSLLLSRLDQSGRSCPLPMGPEARPRSSHKVVSALPHAPARLSVCHCKVSPPQCTEARPGLCVLLPPAKKSAPRRALPRSPTWTEDASGRGPQTPTGCWPATLSKALGFNLLVPCAWRIELRAWRHCWACSRPCSVARRWVPSRER